MVAYIALTCAVVLVAALVIVLYPPPSPVTSLEGFVDTVEPVKVHVGGIISVSRNLRSTTGEQVTVFRTIVRGDCKVSCEIVELTSSMISLAPGDYHDAKKDHVLPITADPGVWKIVFTILWKDALGRTLRYELPQLDLEIVK